MIPRAGVGKEEREEAAAERLYGLLPPDQAEELKGLWEEFEARETAEAKFAACLDRLQPFLLNYFTEGGTWRIHSVPSQKVRERMAPVGEISPVLEELVAQTIQKAIDQGYLKE